jgi:hypothetical protein
VQSGILTPASTHASGNLMTDLNPKSTVETASQQPANGQTAPDSGIYQAEGLMLCFVNS